MIGGARENCNRSRRLQNLQGFEVSPWWKSNQENMWKAIEKFLSTEEAIQYAQDGKRSAFDHRIKPDLRIIETKAGELYRRFPEFKLEESHLQESDFSINTCDWKGKKVSNIFFWHLNAFLSCIEKLCASPLNVLEIGGGYGALARIFKLACPDVCYTIIDLPESLFFAEVFLRKNFPGAKIAYLGQDKNPEMADFILCPVALANVFRSAKFDLAINMGSLQEMPDVTVDFWMDFIETGNIDNFYSLNYFLNPVTRKMPESSNFLCPKLGPEWGTMHWEIDPKIITIDSPRNWLEICMKREPNDNMEAHRRRAEFLLREACKHRPGSNPWIWRLWKSVWYCPTIPALELLIGYCLTKNFREATGYQKILEKLRA